MSDEVILLGFWPSMFSMRVRIALAEKQIKYEYKEEDLMNNKSQLLLEMNPIYKKIPVLIHNGKPVCESKYAVEYIDEVWNEKARLLPFDPYERAQARFWVDYIDNKLPILGHKLWATKGKEQEAAKEELVNCLKVLVGALDDKPYFGGRTFGFVDIALIGFYSRFCAYEKFGNFKVEDECPKLMEWAKRCIQRESVSQCLVDPQKILDFVSQLKKRLGIE